MQGTSYRNVDVTIRDKEELFIRDKFKMASDVFVECAPKGRKNFFSYTYLIVKLDELLNLQNKEEIKVTTMRREHVKDILHNVLPKDIVEHIIVQYIRLVTKRVSFGVEQLKNRNVLQNNDKIWKKVCDKIDMSFIPSMQSTT